MNLKIFHAARSRSSIGKERPGKLARKAEMFGTWLVREFISTTTAFIQVQRKSNIRAGGGALGIARLVNTQLLVSRGYELYEVSLELCCHEGKYTVLSNFLFKFLSFIIIKDSYNFHNC